jgi:hypothetical protein
VAIPAPTFPSRDLVGHHEVLLDPVDGRGLIAAPALVVRERFPLVALLDRGIVVEGRQGALPLGGHPAHQGGVDAGQSLEGGVLGRDEGHLPGGPGGLGRPNQPLVVAGVQEVAEPIGRGEAPAEEPLQPAIGLEDGDVIEAVAPGGEEEDQGLDLLGLGVAALALAHPHRLADHPGQAEGAHGLQAEGQPRPAGHRVRARDDLHHVRQEALAHRGAGRARGRGTRGGALCRSARFTAVSSSTILQSSL